MASKNSTKSERVMNGWHFMPSDLILTNNDGRKVKLGVPLRMQGSGTPWCCNRGMHASVTPADAARFQRGPVLSKVEVWGDLDVDPDKFCGRFRRAVWIREIKEDDLRKIAALSGLGDRVPLHSLPYSVEYWLKQLAVANPASFNKAVVAWAKANGSDNEVRVHVVMKPLLRERDLLALLTPRVIRTKKEIMQLLGKGYDMSADDSSSYDDRVEEILDECDRVRLLSDIDGKGTEGYVLVSRRR